MGPPNAGPSQGYRAPAIAAAMAAMQGYRVAAKAVPRSLGWGNGSSDRQLRLVWAHNVGRRRFASARALRALLERARGKTVGSAARRNGYRVLHSVGNITTT